MKTVLSVRNLRYRYEDGTEALRGIDFDLQAGECVALFGPNGSGKTTFALHLAGLLEGAGEIEICGLRLGRESMSEVRRRIGFVFQDSDDQLFMPTVIEDVAFGLLTRGLSPEEARHRAEAALRRTEMIHAADRAPYHLSAGEKRRVALAGVLATEPEILILDEPTTFLDPPALRELVRLLDGLGQAKLLITHDVHFARRLATRATFFRGGKVAADGPVEEVVASFDWDVSR